MRFFPAFFILILYSSALLAQARTHYRPPEVIQAQQNTAKMFMHYLEQNKTDSVFALIDSAWLTGHTDIRKKIMKAAKFISQHYVNYSEEPTQMEYGNNSNYIALIYYPDYSFQLSFVWDNKNSKVIKVDIMDKKQIRENQEKANEHIIVVPPSPGTNSPPAKKE